MATVIDSTSNSSSQSQDKKPTIGDQLDLDCFKSILDDAFIFQEDKFPDAAMVYTLTHRLSETELIDRCAKNVRDAKKKFLDAVSLTRQMYEENIQSCKKMDIVLGIDCSSKDEHRHEAAQPKKQKDGSWSNPCPIHLCNAVTFKLKRHIMHQHKSLSDEQIDFALIVSRMICKNIRRNSSEEISDCTTKHHSKKSNQLTRMVNRKHNLKECNLCKKLVINMSDHVMKTHKISKDNSLYDFYVKESKVVPECYTKLENGQRVKLSEEEREEAAGTYSEEIQTQTEDLEKLKELRNSIEMKRKEIIEVEDIEKYRELKTSLEKAVHDYKNLRYKDTRCYTETVKVWRDCFFNHLVSRKQNNPERSVRMAIDVFLPYETVISVPLNFTHISDPVVIREILNSYRSKEGTTCTSKIKYIKMFSNFIKFLFNDVSSPEYKNSETNEELAAMERKLRTINHEIDNQVQILSKSLGSDNIKRKDKAQEKLLSEEEVEELFNNTRQFLLEVNKDMLNDTHKSYSAKQILKVRNSLIVMPSVRLGRRAKEFTKMKLDEIKSPETEEVNGELFYFVKVVDQKTTNSTGEPALIPYEVKEYEVLKKYAADLRPLILQDKFSDVVFPSISKVTSKASSEMSLSGVFNILQSLPTSSGKKISSRILRSSFITNSRNLDLSETEKREMAKAMNHSYDTAERYYNYKSLTCSVTNTLSLSRKSNQSSSSQVSFLSDPSLSPISSGNDFCVKSSTPVKKGKRKLSCLMESPARTSTDTRDSDIIKAFGDTSAEPTVEPESEPTVEPESEPTVEPESEPTVEPESEPTIDPEYEPEAEITLKNLRGKKIKSAQIDSNLLKEVRKRIEAIILVMKEGNRLNELKTASGLISTKPITKWLPNEYAEKCSTYQIRRIVEELLTEITE